MSISGMFQRCFREEESNKYQTAVEGMVSRVFLNLCVWMLVITATRAEGGLVWNCPLIWKACCVKNCLVKIICSATVRIAQLVEQSKKQQSCSVNSFYWGGTSDSAGYIILNSSTILALPNRRSYSSGAETLVLKNCLIRKKLGLTNHMFLYILPRTKNELLIMFCIDV